MATEEKPEYVQDVLFDLRQDIAKEAGNTKFYGDGGTLHSGTRLDIEMDDEGNVCSVWFRCRTLPFRVYRRSGESPSRDNPDIEIHGIELKRIDES